MMDGFNTTTNTEFLVYTDYGSPIINLKIDKVSGYIVGKLNATEARKLRTLLTRAIRQVEDAK